MKTKSVLSTSSFALFSSFAVLAAGAWLWGCSPEFESTCPEGTTQTAGGGDIDQACTPNGSKGGEGGAAGAGQGGAPSGSAGMPLGGSGVGGSSGGGSGGMVPVPPDGVCSPGATKCGAEGQQICGADGQWGAPTACDIACDAAGSACVVPVQVSVGDFHACALLSDGTVRCWGDDAQGQLGQGAPSPSSKPLAVAGLTDVEKIDVGGSNSCALRKDKSVLCWGDNASEQISPDPNSTSTVVRVPTNLGVQGTQDVAAGGHLCLLRTSGSTLSAQCKGGNTYGQLGNNSDAASASFVSVLGLPAAPVKLSRGAIHTCALTQGGAVYCWGWNVPLGFEDSSGGVFTPRQYASAGQASVATGLSFSCSVGNDLTAACWGSNDRGQLGTGTTALRSTTPLKVSNGSNAKDVAGGFYSACLLKADGTVWCWGANDNNQLGNTCSQVTCTVSGGGSSFVRSPVQVQQLVDAKQIDGGGETMCALRADNSVACWGRNDRGQLGSGFLGGSSATPVSVIWK